MMEKTMVYNTRSLDDQPGRKIAGWLVCLGGVNRGRDFAIFSGYNWIGKDESMDICIKDADIADSHHCAIIYDERNNQTFLVPEDGCDIRLDGEAVTEPVSLPEQCDLCIGDCPFIYIAFCYKDRSWKTL